MAPMNMNSQMMWKISQWFNAHRHILKITERKPSKNSCIQILINSITALILTTLLRMKY